MNNDDSVQIAASSPCDGARSPGCGETTAPGTQWEKNRNSQAAQQSFEPTRLCRRIAARDDLRQKRSRPEMATQRLDKIESAPGNGMVSEASTHKIWYRGVRLPCPTPADVPRPGGTPREGGAARASRRLSTRLARRPGSSADSVVVAEPRRRDGGGNFPPCKALKTHKMGKESRFCASPFRGPAGSVVIAESWRRGRDRGGKFSALQGLENSQNGEGISILRASPDPLLGRADRIASSGSAEPARLDMVAHHAVDLGLR